MKVTPFVVAKAFIGWILLICIVLTILLCNTSDEYKRFYRFGPHNDLRILGIQIDTGWKYFGVVLYSFVNSIFRTAFHNYLNPWMINNVQDEERPKQHLKRYNVFEIATVCVVYNWTDWLLYMNILLAQIDMMLIEVTADLMMSYVTTYYYLGTPKLQTSTTENLSLIPRSETAIEL